MALVFDKAGNLYLNDFGNNRVLRYAASDLAAGLNGPSANLAAWAQESRRRPASGSPPLARAACWYSVSHSSSAGIRGNQANAA